MRLFPDEYIHRLSRYLIIFLILFAISGEVPLIFQCIPPRAMFERQKYPDAKCMSSDSLFGLMLFQAIVMLLTDMVILVMPMVPLWRLKLPLRKRLEVMLLFGLGAYPSHAALPPPFSSLTHPAGALACIAALVRFWTLSTLKDDKDFTYSIANSAMWINVELHLGMMAGSLPSLRLIPGLRRIFASCSKGKGKSSGANSGGLPDAADGDVPLRTIGGRGAVRPPVPNPLGLSFYELDSTSRDAILSDEERSLDEPGGSAHAHARSAVSEEVVDAARPAGSI